MGLEWRQERPSFWDKDKKKIIGGAPEGIFELRNYKEGEVIPGEWWRVEEGGSVVGYGWMDTTFGDAEILLAVDPAGREHGVGTFILDRLEGEAAARGLNYMFNVVRPKHPDRSGITDWLTKRRFEPSSDGSLLRRRVKAVR